MQAMDYKALARGQEPLLKVALIQLAEQGSILSVTLAHCVAGMQHLEMCLSVSLQCVSCLLMTLCTAAQGEAFCYAIKLLMSRRVLVQPNNSNSKVTPGCTHRTRVGPLMLFDGGNTQWSEQWWTHPL